MYPTLFQLGSIRIDSYSVVWFIALSLAIVWGIKRLDLYGLDEDDSRSVMAVSFMFMLFGARAYEYFQHWSTYINNPKLFLDWNRGGLHEIGAVLGAILSAFVMCLFKRKVSFIKLCDVAIIPAFLAIAVGRWGCFLNGCCLGLPSKFITAVHFPRDRAGVFRHPVQIYYSVIAVVIILILLWVERRTLPLQKKSKRYYSVLAPLGMILYGVMRLAVSPVRTGRAFMWRLAHASPSGLIAAAIPFLLAWLVYSLFRLNADSSHK